MLRSLGRGGESYWWEGPGKMRVGAGLQSCGNASSTAAIWGSDSGLVFLLHNQFAVWIPLHITLNIHSLLDLVKSCSWFFFFFFHQFHLICLVPHFFVGVTFIPWGVRSPVLKIMEYANLSWKLTSHYFFPPLTPQNLYFSNNSIKNVWVFLLATVNSAPTAF